MSRAPAASTTLTAGNRSQFDASALRLGSKPRTRVHIYTVVSLVALGLAVDYVCAVFYLRWDSNRVIAQRAAEAKKVFGRMGGDRFEILEFFAHPPVISRGDSTMLCYSVSNAKSVTL